MLTEQDRYTCAQFTLQFPDSVSATTRPALGAAISAPAVDNIRLFEFAANAPATVAERHPHLTVLAVSVAVLLAAITAEIECLAGSGYFWR